MPKFIIYFECIVVFTIYPLFISLVKKLQLIGYSAEWYSSRGLHPWEGPKAIAINEAEKKENERKQRQGK